MFKQILDNHGYLALI